MSKTIVMLSGQYMPEVFGGAQQQCGRQSAALSAMGKPVTIFTNRCSLKLPGVENQAGVTIIRAFTGFPPQTMGRFLPASLLWMGQWLLWAWRRRRTIMVIHAHQAKLQAYLACVAGSWLGIPSVVKAGNAGEHDDLARMKRKFLLGPHIYRTIIRHTSAFAAISDDIVRELRNHGISEDRIFRIPNGVGQPVAGEHLSGERARARERLAPELGTDDLLFVYTGRLEPVKNLGLLLDAFALWAAGQTHRRVELWLVGDGVERHALEQRVAAAPRGGLVRFIGYVDNVTPYLLAADFLAMSSIAEGMSNSLLEAMAVGTVPICTPVSGAKDLITEGWNGFLSPGSTVRDYSETLAKAGRLTAEELKSFSTACFERISGEYTVQRVAEAYLELYERLEAGYN